MHLGSRTCASIAKRKEGIRRPSWRPLQRNLRTREWKRGGEKEKRGKKERGVGRPYQGDEREVVSISF